MNTDIIYKSTKFINISSCPGWERSKNHIFPMPVPSEFCDGLTAQQLVCKKFLDFYICYCIRDEYQGYGTGSVCIIDRKMLE